MLEAVAAAPTYFPRNGVEIKHQRERVSAHVRLSVKGFDFTRQVEFDDHEISPSACAVSLPQRRVWPFPVNVTLSAHEEAGLDLADPGFGFLHTPPSSTDCRPHATMDENSAMVVDSSIWTIILYQSPSIVPFSTQFEEPMSPLYVPRRNKIKEVSKPSNTFPKTICFPVIV